MASKPKPKPDVPEKVEGGQQSLPAVSSPSQPVELSNPPAEKPRSTMMAAWSAEMYSGPIPPPAVIQGWEEILPGAADRILKMAENQSAHRIAIEGKVIDGDNRRANVGLWLGFIVCLTMILGGCLLIGLGHDVAGASIIGTTLIGIGGVFIKGELSRSQERKERAEAVGRAKPPRKLPSFPATPGQNSTLGP